MGHSKGLKEHGDSLFITKNPLPKHIEELYQYLGEIKREKGSVPRCVNNLTHRGTSTFSFNTNHI